jgi:hypothetical protein
MMGYATRDYGLIAMATEGLNSGCSRKDAATEGFHWRFWHVSVASSMMAAAHGLVKLSWISSVVPTDSDRFRKLGG